MSKTFLISAGFLALVATAANAQMAERVDPTTGNYVPVTDPFLRDDPDPNMANPNRLGNRQSQRNARTTAPASPVGPVDENDGLTPAQRMAAAAANNGQAPPVITNANGQPEQTTSDGFVSMGDMATYNRPGSQSGESEPFAKPDWWPQ